MEVLMSSVYVSIYLPKNNSSCRELASDFFPPLFSLVLLDKRRDPSSVTRKAFLLLSACNRRQLAFNSF